MDLKGCLRQLKNNTDLTHAEKDVVWWLKKELGVSVYRVIHLKNIVSILGDFFISGHVRTGNYNPFRQLLFHYKGNIAEDKFCRHCNRGYPGFTN